MSTPTTPAPPGDSTDLDEIRKTLGAALHAEVKAELKHEAARPARLRTKAYTLAAGLIVAATVASLWYLWPAEKKANQTEPAKPKPAGEPAAATPGAGPPRGALTDEGRANFDRAVKQVLDLAEEGRAERARLRAEVAALLTDDRGRKVAAADDLVARFRVATEDPLLAAEADAFLDALDQAPFSELDAETKRQRATRAILLYRRAGLSVRAVANAAAGRGPAADTLGAAVERARERDEFAALGLKAEREKEARAGVARKVAEEAARKAEREAEEKRWGALRPGSLWKGKLALEDGNVPCDLRVNARSGDKVEGVIGWTCKDRRDEAAFAGEVDAGRVKWKTTRTVRGNPWLGVSYDAAVDGEAMAGTWRQRDGNTYPFRVALEPEK